MVVALRIFFVCGVDGQCKANGTPTSPVIRGAWIMERLLFLLFTLAAVTPAGASIAPFALEYHMTRKDCFSHRSRTGSAGKRLTHGTPPVPLGPFWPEIEALHQLY